MEALSAQQYEDKARHCHQLAWYCADPAVLDVLKGLAREYDLMAAALSAREAHHEANQQLAQVLDLRHVRH